MIFLSISSDSLPQDTFRGPSLNFPNPPPARLVRRWNDSPSHPTPDLHPPVVIYFESSHGLPPFFFGRLQHKRPKRLTAGPLQSIVHSGKIVSHLTLFLHVEELYSSHCFSHPEGKHGHDRNLNRRNRIPDPLPKSNRAHPVA